MVEEFPDEDQRMAVCEEQWQKGKDMNSRQTPESWLDAVSKYRKFLQKVESPFNLVDGERSYEIKSQSESNEVILYDEIGFWGVTSKEFREDVSSLTGDLSVRIDSPGGDVFAGMAMYNTLKQYNKGIVTTYIDGEAASAGGLVFLAGDKRKAPETSMLMLHEAWGLMIGNKKEGAKFVEILGEIDDIIYNIILSQSKKGRQETIDAVDNELWVNGKDAMEWGFVSELISYEPDDVYNKRPIFDLSVYNKTPGHLARDGEGGMPSIRNLESKLREAGLSKTKAKALLANGKSALEDIDPDELWAMGKKLEMTLRG